MPIVPRGSACSMPSSTDPLDPAWIAANRANANAVSNALNQAQQATNSLVFRSPWDWRSWGINVMKDIARQNQQRYYPGIFPPFGGPVPSDFIPRMYPPGVLTPQTSGVGAPRQGAADGGWGTPGIGPDGSTGMNGANGAGSEVTPDVAPIGSGSTRGMRAGRYQRNGSYAGRFDAAKTRNGGKGQAVSPVQAGTGGSGAGSGLVGAPFTVAIQPKGAPPASVQPAGGGSNPPSASGPNGSQGFTGRAVQCDAPAQGVQILGPNTGTAPVPAPVVTIPPQPVEAPVLPESMMPARYRGMSGAFPVGCTPNQGIQQTQATSTNQAAAAASATAAANQQGNSWWAWLLVLGLAVVVANSGDSEPAKKERAR